MAKKERHELVFLMLKQWKPQLQLLTTEQRGILLMAIYDYQCDGKDFETEDRTLAMMWSIVRQAFEDNKKRYAEICELNRQKANIRWHKNDAVASRGTTGNADDAI